MLTLNLHYRRHYHTHSYNHHHHGNKLTNNSSATMETMHGTTSGEANDKVQGNMFELFRTYDGEEYTVYIREDGKRFYVDFEEQVQ